MSFVSSLSREQAREASAQSFLCWGGERTVEQYIARAFAQLEKGDGVLGYSGLYCERGKLISALKRYSITLQRGAKKFPAIGLGAIFTPEAERRKGAATELIQSVLQDAKQGGQKAALLFSDISPSYYERFGLVPFESVDRSLPCKEIKAEGALSTQPMTREEEEAAFGLRERLSSDASICCAPTLAEWRFFRWRNTPEPGLLLFDGDALVGYTLVGPDESSLWVYEWMAPGISEDRMLSTLKVIAEGRGFHRIEGWFPKGQIIWEEKAREKAAPMVAGIEGESASFWSVNHF